MISGFNANMEPEYRMDRTEADRRELAMMDENARLRTALEMVVATPEAMRGGRPCGWHAVSAANVAFARAALAAAKEDA